MELAKICLVLATTIYTVAALTGQMVADHFRATLSPGSGVFLPSDANYSQEVTGRWNTFITPSFEVAVRPATVSDVQQVVRYAAQNKVPFLTTGGGHGYLEPLNNVKQAINLDLGLFKDFKIDKDANTLTIGGSLRFTNITQALQDAGKDMPVGSCSCVGMVGASMGGGIGPYVGLYGLISDQLLSVEMVTSNGDILHVSPQSHADLFWGLKGAGFNFGVITSAVFKIHDANNMGKVTNADMTFPGSMNESVWKAAAQIVATQPKELHLGAAMGYNASMSSSFIIINGIYAGPPTAARAALKPLLDLNPLAPNITEIPWVDLATAPNYGLVAGGCKPAPETDFSANLRTMNIDTLMNVTNFVATTQAANPVLAHSLVSLTMPGKAIGQGPGRGRHASAFPWRRVAAFLQVQASVPTAADAPVVEDWGRKVRDVAQAGSGYRQLGVYVNTAHGDEGPEAWYSKRNLGPLCALKRRYDPDGMFGFYAPIP